MSLQIVLQEFEAEVQWTPKVSAPFLRSFQQIGSKSEHGMPPTIDPLLP